MTKLILLTYSIVLAFALAGWVAAAQRQSRLDDLRGVITDQQGALVVGAKVILISGAEATREAITDGRGEFQFRALNSGIYKLKVIAPGFAEHEETITLDSAQAPKPVAVTLYPSITETVRIEGNQNDSNLDPERAAGAQVLNQAQLELLPDDPDQFSNVLQLLATSSGSAPGEATVTVDGFLNEGRLPPKSAIREVRINSNIFSAEYDKPPYRGGRIEVFTKPGAGAFHGSGFFNFNDSAFNARDVFAPERAPITTRRYGLQLGGPIAPKKAGVLFAFEARDINESATVNAVTLDDSIRRHAFTANVPTPKLLLIGSGRADWQMTPSHVFMFRYDFKRDRLNNQNVGGFDLPSRAVNGTITNHDLRFSETAAINKAVYNEARLGISFARVNQRAASDATAINVLGAFTSGGAGIQSLKTDERRLEFYDNLFLAAGDHSLKLGVQLVGRKLDDARAENFNGTFTFGGALGPALDERGQISLGGDGQPLLVNISGLEQYRRTLLNLPGGRPTRFSINLGEPSVSSSQWTLGLFAQDEWNIRQNLLLSLGLRYEAQSNPSSKLGFAPRVGIGYSPDKKRRWVLRARAGIFYDRVGLALPLETLRFTEGRQRQIVIDSPSFPDPFEGGTAANLTPTVRRSNPDLRPPTSFQTQIGFERQLPQGWKLDVSHYWSRGWNLLRSRNVNAPIVAEGVEPRNAPRPFGVNQNILQFESSGKLAGQVLFVGLNQSSNKRFNVFSSYLWFDFKTNADHPFLLPQSSYEQQGEWARPVWQTRHRFFLVGLINFPWKLRAAAEFNLASGAPYNVTTGRDNNVDGNFNDRPGLTDRNAPGAVATQFGVLDPTAVNGTLERNSGTNPAAATLDFNLSRTFGFGGKSTGRGVPGGYQLTVNLRANNLLNRANLYAVDGVLNSPFFGRPNQAQSARRIEIGARLNF